jgi:hypothetical protein
MAVFAIDAMLHCPCSLGRADRRLSMLFLGRALRIFGSVTCAFWLVGAPSAAQNPVSSAPNSNPTFHTSSNLVVVNVVVSDRDGKPILGLGKEDFELIEDGKVQSL